MAKQIIWFLAICLIPYTPIFCDGLPNGDFETGTLDGWTVSHYEDYSAGTEEVFFDAYTTVASDRYTNSNAALLYSYADANNGSDANGIVELGISQAFTGEAGQQIRFDCYFSFDESVIGGWTDFYVWAQLDFGGTTVWSLSLPVNSAGSGVWSGLR